MALKYAPSRDDVKACYRMFLGRLPESEAAIDDHLASARSLEDLIACFSESEEAARLAAHKAAGVIAAYQDPSAIDLDASPQERLSLTQHVGTVWSAYGTSDAYFSVLTDPRFHRDTMTEADKTAFYRSGDDTVAAFIEVLRRNGLESVPRRTMVELGCGVGRMVQPFVRRGYVYTGVDISEGHLSIARQHAKEAGAVAAFVSLREYLRQTDTCDLFFSLLVLQHNPPPVMAWLLDHGLSRLKPGGLAYFQVPCFLHGYKFGTAAYLADLPGHGTMEMHALPQHHVFQLLHQNGLVPVEVLPGAHIGGIGYSYTFLAKKVRETAIPDLNDAP